MPTLLFRLILLVIASVVVHSSMPAVVVDGITAGALSATVAPATAQAGEAMQLQVQLNRPGGMSTIFTLDITYADGATQQVVGSTIGRAATLAWEIPAATAAGPATFRLTTGDCGCGERSMRVQNVLPPGVVEGEFLVGR